MRPLWRDGAGRADWLATLRTRDDTREREIDAQAAATSEHVNPIAFFRALDRAAGSDSVFVADGGDFVATASYILRPRGPLAWLDPGAFGTLGVGAGFALGAQLVPLDQRESILRVEPLYGLSAGLTQRPIQKERCMSILMKWLGFSKWLKHLKKRN